MATNYPGSIDSFTNPVSTDTLASVPHAAQHDNINDAVKAVETTLGVNPQGSYATVAARLAASTGTMSTWRKAAAGGETSLSGTDDFSVSLTYTVGQEQVFINGVLLERGVDYTASTGTSITGLTALVAGDIATVISVGSFNVSNTVPLSTVTAKGDLIAANGSASVTNLPAGSDGSVLMANSSSGTGLAWATPVGSLANPVINGGMDIWQRGTSVTHTGSSAIYSADRWGIYRSGFAAGLVSSQISAGSTLPQFKYAMRVQRTAGDTSTAGTALVNPFETINSLPYVNQTITLSFYARAGANYSAASNAFTPYVITGTGTDQNPWGGFTGYANAATSTVTLTTSWQRFVITGTVASTATQMSVYFATTPTGTAGANDYYDITGVQIDLGTYTATTAPAFRRAGGTLSGELAACQRYYYRWTANAAYSRYPVMGSAASSTFSFFPSITPVTLRTPPTALESSSNWRVYDGSNVVTGITLGIVVSTELELQPYLTATASSGLTQFRPYMLTANNDASAYIGLSAEL